MFNNNSPKIMDKIQSILSSACALFARKGYEHTPISEIAEMAGVAGGTIIYHFKSKENLLHILTWRTLNEAYRLTVTHTANADSGLQGVMGYAKAFFEFLRTRPDECLLLFKNRPFELMNLDSNGPHADIRTIQRQYTKLLEECMLRGLEDGSVVAEEPRLAALNVFSTLIGSAWQVLFFHEEATSLERVTLAGIQRFLSG